jgi:hypothetical protein
MNIAGGSEVEGKLLTDTAQRRRKRMVRKTPKVLIAAQIRGGRAKACRMSLLRCRSRRQKAMILFMRPYVKALSIQSLDCGFASTSKNIWNCDENGGSVDLDRMFLASRRRETSRKLVI